MVNAPNTTATIDNVPTSGENYSAYEGAFEGPEKLLEIWFSPSAQGLRDHQNLATPPYSEESSEAEEEEEESDLNDTTRFSPPHPLKDRRMSHAPVDGKTGLRVIPKPVLDKMLALVKCTVLNVITNENVDAYLLSESSMFVYPHKIILKTCGTTTLLLAVACLLELAKSYCGFEKVWRVFYSRKAFMFPERQLGPHRSWEDEVAFLDKFFDAGSSYIVGKELQDQWHLYMTKPSDDVLHDPSTNTVPRHLRGVMQEHEIVSGASTPVTSDSDEDPSPFGNQGHSHPDQTVEIHMTGLNPHNMKKFYHNIKETPSGLVGGQWVDKETGIDQLYPQANIDSYLFEPCGYSSNGLWQDRYFTFHVTPEPQCSYASFETNIPVEKSHANLETSPIEALITRVVDIFDPSSFTVTYFTSHHQEHYSNGQMVRSMSALHGYERTNRILYEFDGYDLVYGHYAK